MVFNFYHQTFSSDSFFTLNSVDEDFAKADTNGNGKLELQEFRNGLPELKQMSDAVFNSKVVPLFKSNDRNHDNSLSAKEAQSFVGDVFWTNLLMADSNNDRKISLNEFKAFASQDPTASEDKILGVFKLADIDGDNMLNMQEGKDLVFML